ncbi:MAG: transketolase [Sedimentisphaeraceae bacterium JB056]
MTADNALAKKCIETIRFLSMDGVQAAKSGHPGMPMGMASVAYAIWTQHMTHNPKAPKWLNRDRFVLSAGHGSMLLYSMLHLTGYNLPLDELKQFRQWGSLTPGHPEYGHTEGVEVTTGPLGQGISNVVGMAIAQKYLAEYYNRDNFNLFDYNIFTIAGDGCLQEGVSSEACSLAGHLGLDNIIAIYDDNHITIDGDTTLSFTEDVAKRFEAYGWDVQVVDGDGNDLETINAAIEKAKAAKGKPSIIQLRSHIGFGSPNFQDTHTAHGAPLGDEEIALIKKNFGWDPEAKFVVPEEVKASMCQCEKGTKANSDWDAMFAEYSKAYPELAKELTDAISGKLPLDIDAELPKFEAGTALATRSASGKTIQALMPKLPMIMGGSADLTPSNNTHFKEAVDFQKDSRLGRYIRFGVREHAMAAIMNGISVSSPLRCYGATFAVFSDYMRGAIRVAALSKYPSIFVLTHDSIGVGEDGPTHQPVEHMASHRAIPNLICFRPGDANETAQAWKYALTHDEPVAMFLTRQNLPVLDQEKYACACNTEKGAYNLNKVEDPDVLILATGSEVSLALEAADTLAAEGKKARVVSMPSWELFERQSDEYKESVLPSNVTARVAVEAQLEQGWHKYIGLNGEFVGMKGFGASAPGARCFKEFGITTEAVVAAAKKVMA